MSRPRFSLKWFLLLTTAVAAVVGTIGKRSYDAWQRRHDLSRQEQIRDELRAIGCNVGMSDEGRVIAIHLRTSVTDQAMECVREATDLRELLSYTPFTDAELVLLENHTQLRTLDVWGPEITGHSLQVLKRLKNLDRLGLGGASISDSDLVHLHDLRELTYFEIRKAKVRGPGLAYVANLPHLKTITFRDCPVDDDGLVGLAKCQVLSRLVLEKSNVTGKGLAHLRGCISLKDLTMTGADLTSGEGLAELTQVEHLDLSAAKISPQVLAGVVTMDNLRSLKLEGANITNAHLAEIAAADQIQELDLRGTRITDAGLVHLARLKRLKKLRLNGTRISDSGLDALAPLKRLEFVFLEGTATTPDGAARLAEQLPKAGVVDVNRKTLWPAGKSAAHEP